MKVGVAGSSGFIGLHLIDYLERKGHEVVILERPDFEAEPLDAIVNLCGENIMSGWRWTSAKKERILRSRIETTRKLIEKHQPKIFVSASGVNYYGSRPGETLYESSTPGSSFLSQVCQAWEKEIAKAPGRSVALRFGIVLSNHGGAYPRLKGPFRIGDGHMHYSWIHLHDLLRIIYYVLEHDEFSGAVNACAPHPITQRALVETVHGDSYPMPAFLLKLLLGQKAEETIFSDIKAIPKKLLDHGFHFTYPNFHDALIEL